MRYLSTQILDEQGDLDLPQFLQAHLYRCRSMLTRPEKHLPTHFRCKGAECTMPKPTIAF